MTGDDGEMWISIGQSFAYTECLGQTREMQVIPQTVLCIRTVSRTDQGDAGYPLQSFAYTQCLGQTRGNAGYPSDSPLHTHSVSDRPGEMQVIPQTVLCTCTVSRTDQGRCRLSLRQSFAHAQCLGQTRGDAGDPSDSPLHMQCLGQTRGDVGDPSDSPLHTHSVSDRPGELTESNHGSYGNCSHCLLNDDGHLSTCHSDDSSLIFTVGCTLVLAKECCNGHRQW